MTERGVLVPFLRAVDPVHVHETPGVAVLEAVLHVARPLLNQSALEILVRCNHSSRDLVCFSGRSKIVQKTDVRSIRELYIMASSHLLLPECCLMYAPLLSRSPVQILAIRHGILVESITHRGFPSN